MSAYRLLDLLSRWCLVYSKPASSALACLSLLFLFTFATPATAQIYTSHDEDGHLVLSNHRVSNQSEPILVGIPPGEAVRTATVSSAQHGGPYDELISEHARLNSIREGLVRAVVQVESAFNPYARSAKGALGLMQLMPATIRQFGVVNPFNAGENIRAGVSYLRQLLDRYDNNEELALAAYNAGSGSVDRHGQKVPPYAETQQYVSKVTGIAGKAASSPTKTHIYKVIEIIDGREVVRYTDRKPSM